MPDWLQTSVRSSTLKVFLVAAARRAAAVLRALLRRLATSTANTGVTAPANFPANENVSFTGGCLELTPTLDARPFAKLLAGPAVLTVAKALPGEEEERTKSRRAAMMLAVHVRRLQQLLFCGKELQPTACPKTA
mmetsp:Transcript_1695/g.3104  ORF Transcript_1695/g.3104 Transcript_1695/m.3104 type:complete len:135 (-) Transcript_1695:3-407(-)